MIIDYLLSISEDIPEEDLVFKEVVIQINHDMLSDFLIEVAKSIEGGWKIFETRYSLIEDIMHLKLAKLRGEGKLKNLLETV